MSKIKTAPDEFIENLGHGVSLVCSKVHGFGTDALLLADFTSPKMSDTVCDLGTGCGIIPFLWYRDGRFKSAYGVDIQERAISQFEKSRELNGSPDNLRSVLYDLRKLSDVLPAGQMSVVTMNPPYKPVNTGILSDAAAEQIARHEVMCTVTDAANAASRLLNFGGRFCMCHRPERLCDVITAMKNADLEPKRLRFVQKSADTKPWLFLIEGKKGAKPYLTVMPPLLMQNDTGENSDELCRIIGSYAKDTARKD